MCPLMSCSGKYTPDPTPGVFLQKKKKGEFVKTLVVMTSSQEIKGTEKLSYIREI